MLLLVGLGNPGEKYKNTPHNAGFDFVDSFANYLGWDALYSVDDWRPDRLFESELAYVRAGTTKRMLLSKPTTFMNASGRSVKKLMSKFELRLEDIIIVHDDLDLELGSYKIQMGKGPKKHNGVDNIQNILGTTQFLRVRLGVENRDKDNRMPGEDYVLKAYSKDEMATLREAIADATKSLRTILEV